MISFDSYGWIERFTKGSKATKYNEIIDRTDITEIITSSVIFYEAYRKIKSLKGEQTALDAISFLSQSTMVPVDETIALEAADYSLEYNLHMADAIVYATARHHFANLYTSDRHLKGLPGIKFL